MDDSISFQNPKETKEKCHSLDKQERNRDQSIQSSPHQIPIRPPSDRFPPSCLHTRFERSEIIPEVCREAEERRGQKYRPDAEVPLDARRERDERADSREDSAGTADPISRFHD